MEFAGMQTEIVDLAKLAGLRAEVDGLKREFNQL